MEQNEYNDSRYNNEVLWLRRRADAQNVSFRNSSHWPIYIINLFDWCQVIVFYPFPSPLTQHHSISIHLPFLNLIRQRLLIDASRTGCERELFNILSNLIEIEIRYNSTVDRLLFLSKRLIFLLRFCDFFVLFFFQKVAQKWMKIQRDTWAT